MLHKKPTNIEMFSGKTEEIKNGRIINSRWLKGKFYLTANVKYM